MNKIKNMPFVTYGLLIIMVLIFLVMSLTGGTTDPTNLVRFGAKFNPLIQMGQYWRLITPIFIHMGLMHILMNGITLYFVGRIVEGVFGHWRFLVLFLVSGVMGNLASFAFSDSISAGSSTAIFGLFGSFLVLNDGYPDNQYIKSLSQTFLILIGLNIAMDLISPGVDLAGHLGGLIGGYLGAYVTGFTNGVISPVKRIVALVTLIIVAVALFHFGMVG
ncbi:rhomboid family intramembrane serine protease [Lentilactobacillus kribbianus]|uniref:rhomboid family intramembrane serine protease n=1 Tax=Lentilactobacillus kribbianus TaxID=2729622 RepID=UPI001FE9F718